MKKLLLPQKSALLLDASSMLGAWEVYPKHNFPRLWSWLAGELKKGELLSIKPIIAEVKHNSTNCHEWFVKKGEIKILDDFSFDERNRKKDEIKEKVGMLDDPPENPGKGISSNDLELIVAAALSGYVVVTEEGVQLEIPGNPKNSQIPIVCKKNGVGCINFLEIIKKSNAVF